MRAFLDKLNSNVGERTCGFVLYLLCAVHAAESLIIRTFVPQFLAGGIIGLSY